MGKVILLAVLLAMLTGSSLAVIYSKYSSRLKFIEIQEVEKALDQYEEEWGQLQLEMTTLTEHSRVERLARKKLGMVVPVRENIVYIKP